MQYLRFFLLSLAVMLLYIFPSRAFAIQNPLSVPNNRFGVHILFPEEIGEAAGLVNTTGGSWGYVAIPIQAGDRDLLKWQTFMNQSRNLQIVPIVRLATEGDYFNTKVWRKPTEADVVDFANFLNSLTWPTKNRYIVVFNETNRSDEWGGEANPQEYAEMLSFAADTFHAKDDDFFIIAAGLDNAAANVHAQAFDKFTFWQHVHQAVPGIFDKIDGLASHAYPNPGFSQPPITFTEQSIASFKFEKQFITRFTNKEMPIFITETGWSTDVVPERTIATYFTHAFLNVWNDPSVVAVTPFLLRANSGPFVSFSLLKSDGGPTAIYSAIASLEKVKGDPVLAPAEVLFEEQNKNHKQQPIRDFSSKRLEPVAAIVLPKSIKVIVKWLLKI